MLYIDQSGIAIWLKKSKNTFYFVHSQGSQWPTITLCKMHGNWQLVSLKTRRHWYVGENKLGCPLIEDDNLVLVGLSWKKRMQILCAAFMYWSKNLAEVWRGRIFITIQCRKWGSEIFRSRPNFVTLPNRAVDKIKSRKVTYEITRNQTMSEFSVPC